MSPDKPTGLRPELGVALPLLVVTCLLAVQAPAHELVLQLYVLPVVVAGYHFGRSRAILAALTAVALVSLLELVTPGSVFGLGDLGTGRWLTVGLWGATLLVIAVAVAHLYEAKQRTFDDLQNAYHGVLEIFSKFIDTADQYTEAHSVRVSVYATEIARRYGLDEDSIEDIRVAALLHDVGKLDIGVEVLRKAGELTEEEWRSIRRHPALGAQMVGRAGGMLRAAVPLILYHHEQINGEGYYGLTGDEIPIGARIIAVCDAFDAMTTTRSYRVARTAEQALHTLQSEAGSHFDPSIVALFVDAIADETSGLQDLRHRHTHDREAGAELRAVAAR